MARFMAGCNGGRGEATRIGHAKEGISAFAQGWNVGVRVDGSDVDGIDVFRVYATQGSNGARCGSEFATVRHCEKSEGNVNGEDIRLTIPYRFEALRAKYPAGIPFAEALDCLNTLYDCERQVAKRDGSE